MPKKNDKIITLLDIETSGPNYGHDRIIELAFVQIKEGREVGRFETLINPESSVSPFILNLTEIDPRALEKAPVFEDVKDEVFERISGTVIAAHNVRFDYGFLKAEFKRFGMNFIEDTLCTVRLSRKLFPHYRKHSLDALIERFNFVCASRHRAMGDVLVLKQFLELIADEFEIEVMEKTLRTLQKKMTLPPNLAKEDIAAIPESPGVYIFYGDSNYPLYIGKSKNLRKRVSSHFSTSNTSSREFKIFSQIKRIEHRLTAGELGALMLESRLIKEMEPLHNKLLRRSRNLFVLQEVTTEAGYKSVKLLRPDKIELSEMGAVLGIFKTRKKVQDFFVEVVKEYELCPQVLEFNAKKKKGACFYQQLGRCHGACIGEEAVGDYNARFEDAFAKKRVAQWPFSGPILIEEAHQEDKNSGELYVFDNWSLVAAGAFEDQYLHLKKKEEVIFDKDLYKMVRQYMKRRDRKIRKISDHELQHLFNYQEFNV